MNLQRRQLLALGTGLAGAGSALAQAGVQADARPRPAGRKVIGIALGGGSARGFAHIGVLQALEEAKVPISVVAGTSAGSLVGAFYAAGFSPWKMQEVALKVRDIDVADLSSGNKRGMIGGSALKRLVNGFLDNMPIEKMQRRFAAVATDLATGERVAIQRGDTGSAVVASCSIPGVFVPTLFEGRELVDGGLTSPVPVAVARQLGADVVIAVDVGGRPSSKPRTGLYEIILQSFEIMGRSLAQLEGKSANLLIQPKTDDFDGSDFSARKEMIEAGYLAGQAAIPELRRRLGMA
ncbi:MAG: patatin-like phospholipase family protein [Hydrogenophaga sp.]|uniref:patatin-like phospholipase family protein n=1 Tax=Hydrogenophaga sp. TaxID=1904254 RepID=UPI002717EABE|nr:patatin-like phospholipase family protein [Hydrogenophaga sp.]MDO9030034.1 patatin-like phospholipase family protein [Hydrogenophaga sp.]